MIALWPGHIKPGSTTHLLSAFWDISPTLREVAGAEVQADTDGISFMPTLLGTGEQKQHSVSLLGVLRRRGQTRYSSREMETGLLKHIIQ